VVVVTDAILDDLLEKPTIDLEDDEGVAEREDAEDLARCDRARRNLVTNSTKVREREIRCDLLAESYALVNKIVVAPYAQMGTAALAESTAEAARDCNCILLQNHGATALGDSILHAFDRLELMEAAARMTLAVNQLGGVRGLNAQQKDELDSFMQRAPSIPDQIIWS